MFEALIAIRKIFAGRPREDVRSILIKNPGVDREYVRRWLKEFEKSPEKPALAKTFEDILGSIRD